MSISGYFQIVDWQESTITEIEVEGKSDTKLNKASVSTEYRGDIQGKSLIEYQLFYPSNNYANFIGYEIVDLSGEYEGKRLVIEHKGVFENGVAAGSMIVVFSEIKDLIVGQSGSYRSDEHAKAAFSFE